MGELTGEQFLAEREDPVRTFPFAKRSEPAERLARLRNELEEARARASLDRDDRKAKVELSDAEKAVAQAEADLEDATYLIRYKALPRPEWTALLDKHPPTDREIREADKRNETRPKINIETLGPVVIAACVIDPDFSDDEAKRLWHEFSRGETEDLFWSIYALNEGRTAARVGKGSRPTPD